MAGSNSCFFANRNGGNETEWCEQPLRVFVILGRAGQRHASSRGRGARYQIARTAVQRRVELTARDRITLAPSAATVRPSIIIRTAPLRPLSTSSPTSLPNAPASPPLNSGQRAANLIRVDLCDITRCRAGVLNSPKRPAATAPASSISPPAPAPAPWAVRH